MLWAGDGAALTGAAAAQRRGWLATGACGIVEVAVPRSCRRTDRSFVRLHHTSVMPSTWWGSLRIASPARTVVQLAAGMPERQLVAAVATAVQRRQVRLSDVQELVDRHPRLPGAAAAASVVRDLAGGAQSVRELDLVRAVLALGFPAPTLQVIVRDGAGIVTVADAAWDGVLLFYDGSTHLSQESWQADTVRRARAEALGWQVVVVTAAVLADRALLARVLRQAFRVAALLGDAVPRVVPV